ncbi:DUF2155 domain-containing protein [Sneathiella aquimaris]|uniref:DUF2155 domain-containing protein n=1 Tax=Sneathiella aquimaris TaxID=2599305 RepID=UPI00146ECDDF|nr:DUF2155 domain-containing protein [Sneathiella aquimaris]
MPLKRRFLFCLPVVFAGFIVAADHANAGSLVGEASIVRALDKVTARTLDLIIPIGESVQYGTLEITSRKCLKRPPEEPPETSTFLEIRETKQEEETVELFSGWMFASSPALNALEHPVYDVWVIDCKMAEDDKPPSKE